MWRTEEDLATLQDRLNEFAPQIEVFSGWAVSAYRKVARKSSGKCLRIMTMDNCWLATTKQKLATLIAPWYVRPLADYVWLPGREAGHLRKESWDSGSSTFSVASTPATSPNLRPFFYPGLRINALFRKHLFM